MGKIAVLDKTTIDKIAAGEVVERPASVVKELCENAVDAGSTMITVELKEGGTGLIRITDNGSGIASDDVQVAFLRHSTSKIRKVEDLLTAGSLGFRGEALSSISAVSKLELITKQKASFAGSRYVIEGGLEKEFAEAGCPDGTTFLVRDLFYNVPARKKFLKSATTESGYCSEILQRLACSRPDIAFKFINNGKIMFQTAGNGNLKEIIYQLFGREITSNLSEVNHMEDSSNISVRGFIGKPLVARGNRNYENYFINGRYIKSNVISKAIEEAFRPYMMQHKYPFTLLHITMDLAKVDVNVHPSKLEVRFSDGESIYYAVYHAVRNALEGKNLIPQVVLTEETKEKQPLAPQKKELPEQFETKRMEKTVILREEPGKYIDTPDYSALTTEKKPETVRPEVIRPQDVSAEPSKTSIKDFNRVKPAAIQMLVKNIEMPVEKTETHVKEVLENDTSEMDEAPAKNELEVKDVSPAQNEPPINNEVEQPIAEEAPMKPEQLVLPDLLRESNQKEFRMIGQLFRTYWLIEMENQFFMIDQHAAHEKVLYEQTMKRIREKEVLTQQIAPPFIASLSLREAEVLKEHGSVLERLGFEFEAFGGRDYKVTGMPADLCGLTGGDLFLQLLDELVEERLHGSPEQLMEKVASMSCKAAVKGNHNLSEAEARALISQMLELENPYHCPHGRPTTITMTKTEIEKKFKRIV